MPDDVTATEGSDVRHEIALDEGGADHADADSDLAVPEAVEPAVGPALVDRCGCPLCEDEFDDADRFREHLAEAHGLYDEEGTTSVLTLPTVITIESAEPAVPIVPLGPLRTPARTTPPQKFPVGLALFVALLIVLGGGVVYFVESNHHSVSAADDTPELSLGGSTPRVTTASSPASPSGAEDTAAPDTGGLTATADQTPSSEPSASADAAIAPTPTTSSATTTTGPPTTAPQPVFVAPTTSGATVDNCSRAHGQFVVTYSWSFVGGTGWSPLATYTALGGGRYQDTVKVARNSTTPITTVQVTDPSGTRHDVALTPALSTSTC